MSTPSHSRPPLPPRTGSSPQPRSPQPRSPRPRPGANTRRPSNDSVATGVVSVPGRSPRIGSPSLRGPGTPPLPNRGGSPSVWSGREGSTFSRRGETITSPAPADLELFAHHCRLFYLSPSPPEESASYISTKLAALPPSHRAAYTRLQSNLRSQAHVHHLRVRISSFHALMATTAASGSLSLASRSELGGARARAERHERLGHFIRTWNSSGGALLPFFRGLWAALQLQERAKPGGAGSTRVVWEVDDAVFMESGGPEFMLEAVTVIKGVLGFDDQPLTKPPKLRRVDTRDRAASDPFTDLTPPQPAVVALAPKSSRGPAPAPPPSRARRPSNLEAAPLLAGDSPNSDDLRPVPSPLSLSRQTTPGLLSDNDSEVDLAADEADLNAPRFRLWTHPVHISNEELSSLLSLFPSFVRCPVRLPVPHQSAKDVETGIGAWSTLSVDGVEIKVPALDREEAAGVVRCGTGRMWASDEPRSPGWRGGQWYRFLLFWRRLFCLA